MEIKLYSTHCPRCLVLEKKLDQAGIEFELVTEFDVKAMREKGFMGAPILQVGNDFMDFTKANTWINEYKG